MSIISQINLTLLYCYQIGCINNKHIGGTCFTTPPLVRKYCDMKHLVKRPRILLHCRFDLIWHLNRRAILIRMTLVNCHVLASVLWHLLWLPTCYCKHNIIRLGCLTSKYLSPYCHNRQFQI